MKFTLKQIDAATTKADCLVVGVFENNTYACAAKALNEASSSYLDKILKNDKFSGKAGETLMLHHVPLTKADRVLLIGCGSGDFTLEDFKTAVCTAAPLVTSFKNVACFLPNLKVAEKDIYWKMRTCIQEYTAAAYRYTDAKSDPKKDVHLAQVTLALIAKDDKARADKGLKDGTAIAEAISFAKDLGNAPANYLTPENLAKEAQNLAKGNKKVEVTILDEKKIKSKKMGGLMAVGQGSVNPPRMIVLKYQGGKKSDPYTALVGKGITFDAGGVNLKPFPNMWLMKMDMCGSATVLAAFKAAVDLDLPINIGLVVASAENMCSGSAYKPSDVITSYSGKTIEVFNTDAEGRIVLCDAITYAQELFKPKTLVDIATLTGACLVALGNEYSALITNDQRTCDEMRHAGVSALDEAWQMPINDNLRKLLDSKVADMCNIGSKPVAGTVTAAAFLEKFIDKEVNWVHIDCAGTAIGNNIATGRPVAMVIQYLLDHC